MRVIVCAKQVPDTSGVVAVKSDGTMDRASMSTIANPDDMSAVEAALKMKDQTDCEVIVVSMGPPPAAEMLRNMLAMGCDRAVLVSGREFGGSDTFATSQILAAAIQQIGVDEETVILCGRQAIDGDTAQVGPQIAEKLDLPQVTYVADLELKDKTLYMNRLTEDGYMRLTVNTPCLLTCVKELNDPRYPTIEGIVNSFAQNVEIFDYNTLKDNPLIDSTTIGLMGSPTNVYKSFSPPVKGKGVLFSDSERVSCEKLVAALCEKHII